MIPVIDMHADTISMIEYNLKNEGKKAALKKNDMHIDLFKLKEAGYMCQSFALFTELDEIRKRKIMPFDFANELLDLFDAEFKENEDLIRPIKKAVDIENNFKDGLISALISVEEGAVYEGSVEKLKKLYDRGVRKTTLTWNYENELAFPNKSIYSEKYKSNVCEGFDLENGLKKAGFEIIEVCEELGIIIDISHLNDAGIKDIFKTVKKSTPVIASHSNARGITMHPRNLSDEMIKEIADHGGVAGINFMYEFITSLDKKDYEDKGPKELVTKIDDICAHLKYIKNKGGSDILAFGSDFDGIENAIEFENSSGMQRIADGMKKEGFTSSEIEKTFYKNALRVYKTVLK